ncbi:Predicted PurR-regulated permease PerM [Carnobacterium alterfunditum]|uniref:Predicted PurR-regulated permease PerM n=1 Tax=Carnobacterium alterfunditum TaxID=28230 RepID=A0A1N6FFD6_9LACT|nr:AI-2E family transporter [Carnobacterium alterfunditum]SIN93969.1 Predicted PurR-regulated permease PerM [Carnobacterium alterfunditum]
MKEKTKFIDYLGGNTILFTLLILIMLGILIYIYNAIAFIFEPVKVIFSTLIAPMVLAFIFYYLLNPAVDWMERHKVKRIWGVTILFIAIIGILVGLVALAFPPIQDQVTSLVDNFPSYVDSIGTAVLGWVEGTPLENLAGNLVEWLNGWVSNLPSLAVDYFDTAVNGLTNIFSTVSNVVVVIVTFPIIAFFLLKDDEKFFRYTIKIIPPKFRKDVKNIFATINEQVGSYIKGQLMISLSLGVMMFIGFSIIGLDYSGILAIVVLFTSIIPYVGAALAMIPAIIVALITSWFMVLKLLIVWAIIQFVDGNVVEPNIMGKNLNVHPLTIVIVLLVLGDLLGFIGLVLGIPIYAISRVIATFVFRKFKQRYNKYYGDVAGEYENAEFTPDNYQEQNKSEDLK